MSESRPASPTPDPAAPTPPLSAWGLAPPFLILFSEIKIVGHYKKNSDAAGQVPLHAKQMKDLIGVQDANRVNDVITDASTC